MGVKSKSGKPAIVFNRSRGTLVEGDGVTALDADSWYEIVSVADTGSTLPFSGNNPVGRMFKTGSTPPTPVAGDDVYPITFTKVCKTDASVTREKGEIDVTDDCEEGYNAAITDGYTTISGSLGRFMKYDEVTGDLSSADDTYLLRFYDIIEDDGADAYTLTAKNDDDIYIAILRNSDQATTESNKQVWEMFPAILTSLSGEAPLKGVQNGDINFTKAQGPAQIYVRTTNATETVF